MVQDTRNYEHDFECYQTTHSSYPIVPVRNSSVDEGSWQVQAEQSLEPDGTIEPELVGGQAAVVEAVVEAAVAIVVAATAAPVAASESAVLAMKGILREQYL